MKKWMSPEVKNLGVDFTEETKCYCANGADQEVITYHGGEQHRPGHEHNPNKPNKPCTPTPTPNPTPTPTPEPTLS